MAEKILVVDDIDENRRLINLILRHAGYEIIDASDGEDAIKQAQKFLPDLILLDIVMPEIDGYEVCARLKKDGRTIGIPVIFLSAKTETEDKIKGLEIGGVDYITKPFNKEEVVARVRSQLKIRRLTKEIIRVNQELIKKQKYLDEDLKAAAGIQKSLLPQKLPETDNFDFAWEFLPCDLIGGDIFNVFLLDDNHLGVYMLDVSGHGVPSAMVTVSVSQILQPHSGYMIKQDATPFPHPKILPPRRST